MGEFNPHPSSLRDVLVNTLADIGMLPEFKRMSADKVREFQALFGLSSTDTSEIIYEAQERVHDRKYWPEYNRSALSDKERADLLSAALDSQQSKYESIIGGIMFVALVVLVFALALLCRR